MTEQEMRIAMAEACGWKGPDHPDTRNHIKDWPFSHDKHIWVLNPKSEIDPISSIPDYCNDLNAMHDAEKLLIQNDQIHYVTHLWQTNPQSKLDGYKFNQKYFSQVIWWTLTHATARQRAEALLKAKGLWRE